MVSERKNPGSSRPRRPPATTPEAREKQLISLAYDVAEKQLRDGTASSQIITQLMKAGTTREKVEQSRLMREVELLEKKAESMESVKRVEELYTKAIDAMRNYGGQEPLRTYDD